ncbi:MAG: YigZ family protein [Bacteroidaceae bacterium]|nr:YigZ family protein [Bacteroidaceae bacterium]MBR6714585.1 YigZ family protein [Bacteroidaceae bacterium]
MDTYRTIESPAQAKVVVKKSTFLGFAFPVSSEADAEEIIRAHRKQYYDARHVCYAYRIWSMVNGQWSMVEKYSDNGEPSGTASRPMMGAMQKAELTNVLIIAVRYFGGILLGTPGLIAAYREAATLALQAATIVTRTQEAQLTVSFDYSAMNAVMKLLKQHSARIVSQQTDLRCTLTIAAPASITAQLLPQLKKIPSLHSDGE